MKILYVSFFYPPFNTIGGLRSYGQVQALRQAGCEVKVITSANQGFEQDSQGSFNRNDTYYFGKEPTDISNKPNRIKRFFVRMPKFINRYLYLLRFLLFGEQKSWFNETKNTYKNYLGKWSPDIVISSQSPISSHQLASKISSDLKVTWVAEFRDSWSFNPMAFSISEFDISSIIMRKIEKNILHNCSLIIAATSFIKEYYEKYHDKKVYLLLGGWESSNSHQKEKIYNSKIKITHLGSMLYGRRSISPIIKMLANNKLIISKYEFEFVGRHTSLFNQEIIDSRVQENIKLIEQVSYAEAERIAYSADILLILMMDSPQEKYTLTGKIFDYIKYHKPIFIIDSHNSEASKLIQDYEMGYIFKSYKDFEYFLESLRSYESLKKINQKDREIFKRTNQVEQLVRFLQSNEIKILN